MVNIPAFGSIEWWQILVAGISTLAAYSFLLGENPVYRLFEHFYIGIATSITTMIGVKTFLWPKVLKPLLGLDVAYFPDGSAAVPYDPSTLWYLVPLLFGGLYYFILSPRHAWIAQIVIGLSLGTSAGFAFKGIFNEALPQVYDSFRPLYVPGSIVDTISNLVFVTTLLAAMYYFFLTIKRKPGGNGDRVAAYGRWMMMGCFGAFFGATIMARMSLLVERLQFLVETWWPTLMATVSGG